jgi:uncharacterized repeat protein (TIGR02543 family)
MVISGFLHMPFLSIDDSYTNNHIVEIMRHVESFEEAVLIEDQYHIRLKDYSVYGFATYYAKESQTDQLISKDFVYQQYSKQTSYESQSSFSDPYSNQQYAIDMMDLDLTWNFSIGSQSILIAIIDSGIDTDHEEFVGKVSPLSYNSRTKQVGYAHVEDDTGHGTMVAGVIGAKHDNFKGIKGVMPESTLLIIKANNLDNPETLDEDESGFYSDSSIIEGIYYAVEQGADVINLSLGGSYANPLTKQAVEYAVSEGVMVVAASGNDGDSELLYPASFDVVISVSSVDESKTVSSFSNFNSRVDLSAPGEDIVTTSINNAYVNASGTSFAAPQVTGVIGLLLAYDMNQSPSEIYERLTLTAMDRGIEGKDNYYGFGIVNAYAALSFSYYEVSFETFGGTTINPMMVESNQTFTVPNPSKLGHTFDGWYLDSSFTIVFNMGTAFVTQDTVLYAKFTPINYEITLIGLNGSEQIIFKPYGSIITENGLDEYGYVFDRWYYDQSFNNEYLDELIIGDLTLYAKYDIRQYVLTYEVDDEVVYIDYVNHGDVPVLYEPSSTEMTLLGWYMDPLFLNAYIEAPIYNDFALYGEVDRTQLHVTYYDYDHKTVLLYETVMFGQSVNAPNPPVKPNSASLSFVFSGWSESSQIVTENKQIYPIYETTYHDDTVYLIPQVDTIYKDSVFIDQGIYLLDDSIVQEIIGEVDTHTVGRYVIIYKLFYEDEMIDLLVRVVHVIENSEIILVTINPSITTLYEGETYVEEGASSNVGDVLISGTVDTNQPGIYQIFYTVSHQNQIITKSIYVYVIERVEMQIDELYISKENEVSYT